MQSYTVRLLTTSDLPAAQTLRREVFAQQPPIKAHPENTIASSGAHETQPCEAIASSDATQTQPREAIASPDAQETQPREAIASSGAQVILPENPAEDSVSPIDFEAMQSTRMYGAFEGETLIGLLEMRNSQISLFFVREEFRNQGAGRALLNQLLADMPASNASNRTNTSAATTVPDRVSPNVAPNAPAPAHIINAPDAPAKSAPANTPFVLPLNAPADAVSLYARLGFLPSGGARVLNGVRLQPMVWRAERPDSEFALITPENIANEHLSCIIRTKKAHPGVERKRAWLADRLREGHVFRKLRGWECAFIEYAPLETAWVPILGENFDYIYCLWVQGAPKGRGYGRQLMEACIADARARGRSGVCMLGANQQKAWLSDQGFARKFGFRAVDTAGEYALLALSFDGTAPRFSESARRQAIESRGLTVYFTDQCPYIDQRIEKLRAHCAENAIPAQFVRVASLAQAKALPCAFNNWAAFYNGEFITVNQLDPAGVERLRKKYGV